MKEQKNFSISYQQRSINFNNLIMEDIKKLI